MRQPKGVLFDFDGVVVNSFTTHFSAWQLAFKQLFGKDVLNFPESCEGKSPMHIATEFCKIGGDEAKAKELYDLKADLLNKSLTPPILLPGIVEMESYLLKNNIPYGIASNATKQFLLNSVDQLELRFKVIFGFEDYDKPKPAPEAYMSLAAALGFEKCDYEDLWVFEDSVSGATAALTAGMTVYGIESKHSPEDLLKIGCKKVYKSVLEAYKDLL